MGGLPVPIVINSVLAIGAVICPDFTFPAICATRKLIICADSLSRSLDFPLSFLEVGNHVLPKGFNGIHHFPKSLVFPEEPLKV